MLAAERLGAGQRRQPAADQQPVPKPAILVEQQHRRAIRAGAGAGARRLDFHQRDQPVHLRLVGCKPGQDAAEPQRLLAELRPHPVVARGRRIALVEDQVDHLQHRRQAAGELGAARHLERHAGLGERALGAHDALRDGRLRHQEGAGDLFGGEAAEQPQRQRGARLRRQDADGRR